MGKVVTPIADALMDACKDFVGLLSLTTSLIRLGLLASCFGKGILLGAKEARVLNERTVRKSGEGFQPNVYANGFL